ncbi:MAG TPA: DsrE family protein [Gemmatimonadales bacterium]|nr:DsrE family protein [Gemmatimonadales bacterium]
MRRVLPILVLMLSVVALVPAAHAAQMKKRVLLQWTEVDSLGQWVMTKHVGNLLDDLGEQNVQLEVIAYGAATFAVTKDRPQTKFADEIANLTKRGVTFHVCHHAMDLLGVKDDELLSTVTPVKGAMWYIVTKHGEGWQILRP